MIVLLTGSLKSDHLCGPEECGLYCDEDQVCSQDYEVQCITSPCCAQWGCNSADIKHVTTDDDCPDTWPNIGDLCEEEGARCEYGEQECCGEEYPEIVFECMGGSWQGYYVDTLCILGLAPPCPDESTTTTTAPRK